jgi:protein phosphatase
MNSTHLLRWTGMTHRGRYRKNNEDAFLILTFDAQQVTYLGKEGDASLELGDFVFAVSDGMGGANAGEFASRIAVQKITELLPVHYNKDTQSILAESEKILEELFIKTHKEMQKMGRHYEECRGMGATLSLTWFTPNLLLFTHVGDSRIYHLPKNGGIIQITEDHTHAGWLRRQGKINEREERNHPTGNQLQQVLGGNTDIPVPQFGAIAYEKGDIFLLCSDGVIKGVWDHNLENILRTPSPRFNGLLPAARLVKEALEESGKDNITAVVVEVLE